MRAGLGALLMWHLHVARSAGVEPCRVVRSVQDIVDTESARTGINHRTERRGVIFALFFAIFKPFFGYSFSRSPLKPHLGQTLNPGLERK